MHAEQCGQEEQATSDCGLLQKLCGLDAPSKSQLATENTPEFDSMASAKASENATAGIDHEPETKGDAGDDPSVQEVEDHKESGSNGSSSVIDLTAHVQENIVGETSECDGQSATGRLDLNVPPLLMGEAGSSQVDSNKSCIESDSFDPSTKKVDQQMENAVADSLETTDKEGVYEEAD